MEWLANLDVKWVLVGVGAMMVLLAYRRLTVPDGERLDWFAENLQVVLSVVVVVFLLIRPYLFQAFYIPSISMEHTLQGPPDHPTGDRLLVDKLVYRLFEPKRKEIAVFKAPPNASEDQKDFIKRVIGLPGETVEVVPPRLLVDGHTALVLTTSAPNNMTIPGLMLEEPKELNESPVRIQGNAAELKVHAQPWIKVMVLPNPEVRETPLEVTVGGKSELSSGEGRIAREPRALADYGAEPTIDGDVFSAGAETRLIVLKGNSLVYDPGHVLVNGNRIDEPYIAETPRYGMKPVTLGPHQFFMMGDNRNNSNDSHEWGPLDRFRFIGRAEILFFPLNRLRVFHGFLLGVLAALFVAYQLAQRMLFPAPRR